MRIISPGRALPATPAVPTATARPRPHLGAVAGRLVALGWGLAFAGALSAGTPITTQARALTFVGIAWGIVWARMAWERQRPASLSVLVTVAGLQATAAAIALDPALITSWPFFAIAAALAGRLLRSRTAIAAHALAFAAAPLAVALLAPGRTPAAPAHAAIVAAGVLLVVAISAAARRREAPFAVSGVADVRRLHADLADRVARDPQRFALLALELEVTEPRAEDRRLHDRVARALVATVRESDVVAHHAGDGFAVLADRTDELGARLLAQRIERALAQIEVAELDAAFGIAVFPEDGRTPHELLDRVDAELRVDRARRRAPVRLVPIS